MPIISDENPFGIPTFKFVTPYSGKSTYNASHAKAEYRDVSVCMYSYTSAGGRIMGIFASKNYYDFTPLAPYGTTVPYEFTYDGKTVYWLSGYKYANGDTETDYLDPTLDYYEPFSWHSSVSSIPQGQYKVAWLMIYGEFEPDDTDPYGLGGSSGPGGGDGDFDFSSTDIPIPGNPTIGAMDTGFISLYNPSAVQLKNLASYMWAGAFDITQFKKLFADPMDAILGLHIIPTISGHPATGTGTLLVGNINTGLSMPICTEQYYSLDCGSVSIPAKWGAYLDYSPYTKLSLYLPYIGFVPLSPDDCMRGSIAVHYKVDILSGTCVAFVYCYSNRGADGHTLYIFNGSCSCDCPVTSGQYRSALEGLLGVAGSIGRVAAGDVAGGIKDAISNVTAMLKPEIGRSGGFGGSGGLMGIQYPYLVLTVPRMCIPGQQDTYIGYPSFITKQIGELEGFTSIDASHLNNMTCTEAESAEIISLLAEGVIL